ncbi:ABC transporter ATP-binding protein [Metabacillus herbersteinensis]|uniref:ABC transporter ATP-binding protein n=1 Tax=Metabacillus herbersteinensis TaxID=283816 RepID=A0ABV6GL51_9BACI
MKKPILVVSHLHKKINNKEILSDVSIEVMQGEMFGLLGPNGSGKTTLIRAVVGLVTASSGEIQIDGLSIKTHFEKALHHVGAIVENPEFYPFLTGYQNLTQYANMNKKVTKERIDEVVQLVNLQSAIHTKVATYSLGMRQRLGIAQAILHKPNLLILDEPTNGLDPAGIKELRTYLLRLSREENVAVIIASHLLKEIEDLCDRVAIIKAGKILTVRDLGHSVDDSNIKVHFTVDSSQVAQNILRGHGYEPIVIDNSIELIIPYEQIPLVTKQLVEQEVGVYAINPIYKTLEDSFLEWTEGSRK